MKVDVILGLGFGSEAKGLTAHFLASRNKYDWLVSVNSSQAGHVAPILREDGQVQMYFANRQLPSGALADREARIYLGPGAVINLEVLVKEVIDLEAAGVPIRERLYIASTAAVVTEEHLQRSHSEGYERLRAERDGLNPEEFDRRSFGSTREGVAQALAARASRTCPVIRDFCPGLVSRLPGITIVDDPYFLASLRLVDTEILLEGSQGWGLGYFNRFYPKTTSRECSTSALLSYAGLPPQVVQHVYGVARTYPIRVAGNSGPLHDEVDWKTVTEESGLLFDPEMIGGIVMPPNGNLTERTTVTGRVRRVGRWDQELFERAVRANGVDRPVITFANYLDARDEGVTEWESLSNRTQEFVRQAESRSGTRVWALSTAKWGGFVLR